MYFSRSGSLPEFLTVGICLALAAGLLPVPGYWTDTLLTPTEK